MQAVKNKEWKTLPIELGHKLKNVIDILNQIIFL